MSIEWTTDLVLQIIFAFFMALITLYLTILYIKSEAFHTYSCYNIILMSIVLLLDCILKMIPSDSGTEGFEFVLAIIKNFFDKMILAVLSMQVLVLYMGIIHTQYYFSHEKSIFIVGTIVSAIVSITLSLVYSSLRWVEDSDGKVIYDENSKDDKNDNNEESEKRNITKQVLEVIFCATLLVANIFCLIVVLSYISKKSKEAKAGIIEDLGYSKQLIRFLFIFFINIIAIVVSGIIINFDFLTEYNHIIYLLVCFIIDLCYSINKTVYIETVKLFCKKMEYSETDNKVELKRKSTFGDDDDDGNYDDDN